MSRSLFKSIEDASLAPIRALIQFLNKLSGELVNFLQLSQFVSCMVEYANEPSCSNKAHQDIEQ